MSYNVIEAAARALPAIDQFAHVYRRPWLADVAREALAAAQDTGDEARLSAARAEAEAAVQWLDRQGGLEHDAARNAMQAIACSPSVTEEVEHAVAIHSANAQGGLALWNTATSDPNPQSARRLARQAELDRYAPPLQGPGIDLNRPTITPAAVTRLVVEDTADAPWFRTAGETAPAGRPLRLVVEHDPRRVTGEEWYVSIEAYQVGLGWTAVAVSLVAPTMREAIESLPHSAATAPQDNLTTPCAP